MEKRKKNSVKREAILDILRATHEHPSADAVYQRLKPDVPDLSLGTVYRNINMFKNEGTVVSVGVVRGQERLDARTENHAHFICNRCGHVADIEGLDEKTDLDSLARELVDGEVEGHRITVFGLCGACSKA